MSEETKRQAEAHPAMERCLTFEAGGLTLFISTEYVIEIINNHSITSLPLMPPYIKGIVNLRGQILPVVDIQSRMGKEETPYTPKTCIIVLNIDSASLGIIVDSVRQVTDIPTGSIRPIPLKKRQKLLNGMLTLPDGTVLMSVDCQVLSQADQ